MDNENTICTIHQVLLRVINQVPQRVRHVACVGRCNNGRKFYSENMKEINNLDVPGGREEDNIKVDLNKIVCCQIHVGSSMIQWYVLYTVMNLHSS